MKAATAIKNYIPTAFFPASKLGAMWRPLRGFLSFNAADERISPGSALCIAIERDGMYIAHGSRFLSRIRIKGVRSFFIEEDGYPQPKEAASAAALTMEELGAVKSKIILGIPKAWSIVKVAELPSNVKENLSNVVAYEIDRLIPLNPDEAMYDFRVLREDEKKVALVITAARAELINTYLEAFKEKGIHVSRVTVNLSGIGALCSYVDKKGAPLFLEIREDGYEGALYLSNTLAWAFSGTFPYVDGKLKTEAMVSEIKPLIDIAKKYSASPHIIALIKDKSHDFIGALKTETNLPVITFDGAAGQIAVTGENRDIPYGAVGNVIESLWPKAKRLNLLSKGLHKKAEIPVALTSLCLLSIIIIWIIYMFVPIYLESERIKDIDNQIKAGKGNVKEIDAIAKTISLLEGEIFAINSFKESKPASLNILKELTLVIPKTAWLTRVRVTISTVETEGYAAAATELLSRFEASKYFRKAEFASSTFRDPNTNSDRFNIKMEIKDTKENTEIKEIKDVKEIKDNKEVKKEDIVKSKK